MTIVVPLNHKTTKNSERRSNALNSNNHKPGGGLGPSCSPLKEPGRIKIFWPSDIFEDDTHTDCLVPQLLIGWYIKESTSAIISCSVALKDLDLDNLSSKIAKWSCTSMFNKRAGPNNNRCDDECKSIPKILGIVSKQPISINLSKSLEDKELKGDVWVEAMSYTKDPYSSICPCTKIPKFLQLHEHHSKSGVGEGGYQYYKTSHKQAILIIYDRFSHTSMKFYSANPIKLDISLTNPVSPNSNTNNGNGDDGGFVLSRNNSQSKRSSTTNNNSINISNGAKSPQGAENNKADGHLKGDFELEKILGCINSSDQLNRIIGQPLPTKYYRKQTNNRNENYHDEVEDVLSDPNPWYQNLTNLGELISSAHRKIFGMSLREFSAIIQQIDLRLRQWNFWYEMHNQHLPDKLGSSQNQHQRSQLQNQRQQQQQQYISPPSPSQTTRLEKRTAHYVNFCNNMWLVFNDILLGCAMGIFLLYNAPYVSNLISQYMKAYTIHALRIHINWLRGWPAGLKLNQELNDFLGELFLWLIEFWKIILMPLNSYIYRAVVFTGWMGVFGITMQTAIASDCLSLLTLHIYWFYMVAARIYHWQVVVLLSLANLFRGKRINRLRQRIDSYDFDLDQLLLGTILFTLLAYLFPTISVYYLTFTFCRIVVIGIQGMMELGLAFLNHFPIFILGFRFVHSLKLPGGVYFEIVDTKSSDKDTDQSILEGISKRKQPQESLVTPQSAISLTVLKMKSMSIPVSSIFFQYHQLWKQVTENYLSMELFKSLFNGNIITPVPRLQYSMIPDNFDEHHKSTNLGDHEKVH